MRLQIVDAFAKAVKVVILRQLRDKLDELILVNQYTTASIEDNVPCRLPQYRERESRIIRPAELQIDILCVRLGNTLLWEVHKVGRQDVLRAIGVIEVCWLDKDAQPMGCLGVNYEGKSVDVCSVYL